MNEINVEQIMAEIRKDIKDKGYTPDMLSFKDATASYVTNRQFDLDEFRNTIGFLEVSKYVPWVLENPGRGFKGLIKIIVQKLIGPIVGPLSDGQNNFNHQVSEAFLLLLGYVEQQDSMLEEYKKKIEEIQNKSGISEEK